MPEIRPCGCEYEESFRTWSCEEHAVCDFCSAKELHWCYPCRDFEYDIPGHGSAGAWGACRTCYALVERNDWRQLASRSLKNLLGDEKLEDRQLLLERLRGLHDQFRTHRTGPGYPNAEHIELR